MGDAFSKMPGSHTNIAVKGNLLTEDLLVSLIKSLPDGPQKATIVAGMDALVEALEKNQEKKSLVLEGEFKEV